VAFRIDKDIDYNTFSQHLGEVCVSVLSEKVKLKEHKDWFDGRKTDARIKCLQNILLKDLCHDKLLKRVCQKKCREMRNDL